MSVPLTPTPAPEVGRFRRLLGGELVKAGLHTTVFAVLTLVANLITGIIIARALLPEGRGVVVAVSTLAQTLGFVFTIGCVHAVSYRFSRDPSVGGRLLTTWIVILIPLGALAIAVGQLAIPVLFGAQAQSTIQTGRIFLFTVFLVLWTELTAGILLGAGRYAVLNIVRFVQPALWALSLMVLWAFGSLTVDAVLIAATASTFLVQCAAAPQVLGATGGFGRFDAALGRETVWYGFRGQGSVLAGALNQRLDLMILPAFVSSSSLGLYSIAANVSLIVYSIANNFSAIVLPAAVRRGEQGPSTVIRSVQAVTVIAVGAAAILFVFARSALELVYGSAFGDAATSLRLLLPGAALFAAAAVLGAGLYAANRPTIATLTQVAGLLVTVAGLLIFVPAGGITAAAVVSTAAYGSVFLVAAIAYPRVVGVPWRRFVTRAPAR